MPVKDARRWKLDAVVHPRQGPRVLDAPGRVRGARSARGTRPLGLTNSRMSKALGAPAVHGTASPGPAYGARWHLFPRFMKDERRPPWSKTSGMVPSGRWRTFATTRRKLPLFAEDVLADQAARPRDSNAQQANGGAADRRRGFHRRRVRHARGAAAVRGLVSGRAAAHPPATELRDRGRSPHRVRVQDAEPLSIIAGKHGLTLAKIRLVAAASTDTSPISCSATTSTW